MKNKFIVFVMIMLGILLVSESAFAQYSSRKKSKKEDVSFSSHLWYGGGLSLGLSSNSFNFGLSPMVGYKFTEKFSTGVRLPLSYDYYKAVGSDNTVATYSNIDYGLGAFSRYKIFKHIFAQAEYDYLWSKTPATRNGFLILDPDDPTKLLKEDFQKDEFHLGLGYTSGGKFGYEIAVLYNLLEDPNSTNIPFSIRAGFNYKF